MKKYWYSLILSVVLLSCSVEQLPDYSQYVNPLIGNADNGHTFPGACTPFGWVQLSPDTDTIPHNVNGAYQKNAYEYCAGYQYSIMTMILLTVLHKLI